MQSNKVGQPKEGKIFSIRRSTMMGTDGVFKQGVQTKNVLKDVG